MKDCRMIWKCARISLVRLVSSGKWFFLCLVQLVFCWFTFVPITRLGLVYHQAIPPVSFVFYLSFYRMLVLHAGTCVILFSDIPETDPFYHSVALRSGRRNYILGQTSYILIASLLYTLVPIVFSILLTLPVICWQNTWGSLIISLSDQPIELTQRTGLYLPVITGTDYLKMFTPAQAAGHSFCFMWASTAFIGAVIGGGRMLVSRMSGIVTAGIFVAMSVFSLLLGGITIGKWLAFISPMSWSNPENLDWYHGGRMPSPEYGMSFLIIGIIVMSTIMVICFCRKDGEE